MALKKAGSTRKRPNAFSIMSYGSRSVLTKNDRDDLKLLYQLARSGEMSNINGTPIRLMRPFHMAGHQLLSPAAARVTNPAFAWRDNS